MGVLVADVVTVVVVVGVLVTDVVGEVVWLDVGELVTVVVGEVVGVVNSHSRNPPAIQVSAIAFNVSAVASHSPAPAYNMPPNAHFNSAEASPAGPRKAVMAEATAAADVLHASASTMTATPNVSESHPRVPASAGQASNTWFKTADCALQLNPSCT